ncbi:MAG: gfo/Idh/MocA family oxidoreductase [Planctomycetota bacterium]|nr:MAG: gfo/Idh/MocA family oxidoreductase [Planctomycetota bacterium]REJ96551.1 MAG: gfo/Idh/MocA family oxidoreductase [Planctomycetota bacterium]REK21765.1 MAG: gfo/Idh/MocA family oxidoreductase [Planctomycetota bacterium]REK43171.1 MAG: gfo/Idh/MocA family oxidoreductase [Planctomycetota bacterium]
MIKIGIAGLGFMGMIHYLAYQRLRGVKVVAMWELDPKRLAGDWRSIKGNFGPPGEMMDLSGIARYESMKDFLADEKVDMVDVCLPPSLHAKVTVAALKAGKHVFCEKPIALKASDGARMVRAASAARKKLFIGHVLPFFPEFDFAYEAVTSKRYGRLLGGHFKRVISDPQWLQGFYDPERVGGPMLDLHVHDAHFIRLLCGMPTGVSTVGRLRGEVAEYFNSQFRFRDPRLSVTATSGTIGQQGRGFLHGYEIHFERATLAFEFAMVGDEPRTLMPLTVFDRQGGATEPKLAGGDPVDCFVAELKHALACLKNKKKSKILDGSLARDALKICQQQTKSLVAGRPVKI